MATQSIQRINGIISYRGWYFQYLPYICVCIFPLYHPISPPCPTLSASPRDCASPTKESGPTPVPLLCWLCYMLVCCFFGFVPIPLWSIKLCPTVHMCRVHFFYCILIIFYPTISLVSFMSAPAIGAKNVGVWGVPRHNFDIFWDSRECDARAMISRLISVNNHNDVRI